MSRQRRALTLVELLVSISLGMLLITMGSSALVQVTQIAKRDTAQRQAHEDVSVVHQRLHKNLSTMYHPCQMRFECWVGPDGAYGTGDEELRLLWQSAQRSLEERSMGYGPGTTHELAWNELIWIGDGQGGGELAYAVSVRERESTGYTYTTSGGDVVTPRITTTPLPRRDRRRHDNDNDLRFLPGMTKAIHDQIDLTGDRKELFYLRHPLHPPTTEVTNVVFEWIDAGGYTTRCDPDGVSITNPSGGSVGLHYPGIWNAYSSRRDHLVIDGTWLDGRRYRPVFESRQAMAFRPSLVRIRFTLIPRTASGLDLGDEPHLDFTLSFPTTPELPPL